MVTLTTGTGITFEIKWIGVASIDGVLRFACVSGDVKDIMEVFINPENCETLTRDYDGVTATFNGYTVFRGIQINYDGDIIVSLSKI